MLQTSNIQSEGSQRSVKLFFFRLYYYQIQAYSHLVCSVKSVISECNICNTQCTARRIFCCFCRALLLYLIYSYLRKNINGFAAGAEIQRETWNLVFSQTHRSVADASKLLGAWCFFFFPGYTWCSLVMAENCWRVMEFLFHHKKLYVFKLKLLKAWRILFSDLGNVCVAMPDK